MSSLESLPRWFDVPGLQTGTDNPRTLRGSDVESALTRLETEECAAVESGCADSIVAECRMMKRCVLGSAIIRPAATDNGCCCAQFRTLLITVVITPWTKLWKVVARR
jgi:hypothetical protein